MDERTGRQRYEQVCGKLNLDEQSMDAAWDSYKAINNDFGLDVSERLLRSSVWLTSMQSAFTYPCFLSES